MEVAPLSLYVLRHADAVDKHRWAADDALRPLSHPGVVQAQQLAQWFLSRPRLDVIVASPTVRCVSTVLPLAAELHLEVGTRAELLPHAGPAAAELARQLLARGVNGVVCSHGEIIPGLLADLHTASGPTFVECAKASVWLIERDRNGQLSASYQTPAVGTHRRRQPASRARERRLKL
ncbi:MAG: SixA phosphatase family protein [Acidimicrobiales bacterium]